VKQNVALKVKELRTQIKGNNTNSAGENKTVSL
jgi:hypothetical protein